MTADGVIRKLDWGTHSSTFQHKSEEVLTEARKALDVLAKTPENKTMLETLLSFEEILSIVREELALFTFLKYTSTDKAQRDAGHVVEQDLQRFVNEVFSRNDLYEVLALLEPQIETFDDEEKTLLEKTLDEFRHRGASLEKDTRMEFLEIANNISDRQSEYNKVLNEITDRVRCTKEELDGVPSEVYEELEMDGDAYLLPLDYPVYLPVRESAKNPETRKRMERAFNLRGGSENVERLVDTLALRDRQAKLLGFDNFAAYEISRKMAKTPERVFEFLNDLKERLKPLGAAEIKRMRELKAEELGVPIVEVEMKIWDLYYYHQMLMRKDYSIDQNEVRKYFPMDIVVEGVLNIYQKVLQLEFRETEEPVIWHNDVREFKVYDRTDDDLLGVFYLDLYPREGKYKHYAVFPILERREIDGKTYLPIASMVANFQKPTKSQPSLLKHNEVVTFFHEFGHLMHVISNKARYAAFGLDGVVPDFIEVPSKMFENWAWKEDVLTTISGHYEEESRKLPSEFLKKMIEAKLLDIGVLQLRQLVFSLIDMIYHTEKVEDSSKRLCNLYTEITGFDMPDNLTPDGSFGHLMGGYQAGYYSYLWSQAYAEDVFTKFEENGFMDENTGLEFRQKILAPGGSKDPDVMVKDFLGREFDNKAFMRALGI